MLAASALIAGCGTGARGPAAETTPTIPEQWFAARASAQRQGVENLVRFYDPDIILDHRALGHDVVVGRAGALELLHSLRQVVLESRSRTGPLYLSADAALSPEVVASGRTGRQVDVVFHTTMGSTGARSEAVAASLIDWRTQDPDDERAEAVQALARGYLQGWSGADADEVRPLYEPQASVRDSLGGVSAQGSDQITGLVGRPPEEGGLWSAVVDRLPDFTGPAVYAAGRPLAKAPLDTVAILMTVGPGGACPHRIATVLHLGEAGLIRDEERFHRIDDLLRCAPAGALPAGWWDAVVVPEPVRMELTSHLVYDELEIDVYNGRPGLERLVRWALAQYRVRGLGTPRVSRVTFHDRQSDLCEGVTGLILDDAVTLCFDSDAACVDRDCTRWLPTAKRTTLHELAHAWMAEHLTADVTDRFLTATGMATWASSGDAWQERGVELAAESMAWALMDQPERVNRRLGARSCTELAGYVEILTGRAPEPAPPCWVPPRQRPLP